MDNGKKVYPVVITPPKTDEFYVVNVPDIDRMTQGLSLAEALDMAEDLISVHGVLLQDGGADIPEPSTVEPPHEAGELVSWVRVDFDAYRKIDAYRKARDTRAVHKVVTIPAYMDERARKQGLNLSHVLQEALKEQVGPL
jgi:predicted RNase H-like HicB family nuclease